MTATDNANDIQGYARLAGVLGVLTLVAGGFGEAYVPSTILVSGDPAATVQNVVASETLFRWGFAGYLVEALCDAGLTMAFWVLIRPVHRNLAMGMVVFRIISTCGFAAAMMLWFGALATLKTAPQFAGTAADQLPVLSYTLLRVSGFGQALFSMFYGVANVVFGALIYRSGYLPRVFGAGFVLMGIAFTLRTFLLVLAPAYASPLLLATAGIAFPPFIVWLLVKGVNVEKFHARAWPQALT
jgi:Domain of unknown function (DUF4386)